MTTLLTSDLIERCHAGSRNKGFWDVVPEEGQQLMLVVSELAESLEAHRKHKRTMVGCLHGLRNTIENCPEYFETRFVANAKDSVEDELADAYIRLCDFIGGFEYDVKEIAEQIAIQSAGYIRLPENYGHALLVISSCVANVAFTAYKSGKEEALASALQCLEELCGRERIDLATHIDLKLRYNATRPRLHAKAY